MACNNVRALSIQSHVVVGYVGNKSAAFPLQVHGFETDTINSVQLSNHLGYKCAPGQILDSKDLDDLVEGLKKNEIDAYSYILTGYIGSKSFLASVKAAVTHFKSINPDVIYVCDPVMGDNGQMYVPEELLEVYKNEIIPCADIVTPNQFEAEMLTGRSIKSVEDAVEVMDWFHDKGVKIVVLSSTDFSTDDQLICVASHKDQNGTKVCYQICIPKLPVNFTGSGDLFAALLTSWLHKTDRDIKVSLERTVATMQKVLNRTYNHARTVAKPISENPLKYAAYHMELKIIQSLQDILMPEVTIQARKI